MSATAFIVLGAFAVLVFVGIYQHAAHNRSWGLFLIVGAGATGLVFAVLYRYKMTGTTIALAIVSILVLTHVIGKKMGWSPAARRMSMAIAICFLCAVAAGWTWMRFSYCWNYGQLRVDWRVNYRDGLPWPQCAYCQRTTNTGEIQRGRAVVWDYSEDPHPRYALAFRPGGRMFQISTVGLIGFGLSLAYLAVCVIRWRRQVSITAPDGILAEPFENRRENRQ